MEQERRIRAPTVHLLEKNIQASSRRPSQSQGANGGGSKATEEALARPGQGTSIAVDRTNSFGGDSGYVSRFDGSTPSSDSQLSRSSTEKSFLTRAALKRSSSSNTGRSFSEIKNG
jgi:hypothetical protein